MTMSQQHFIVVVNEQCDRYSTISSNCRSRFLYLDVRPEMLNSVTNPGFVLRTLVDVGARGMFRVLFPCYDSHVDSHCFRPFRSLYVEGSLQHSRENHICLYDYVYRIPTLVRCIYMWVHTVEEYRRDTIAVRSRSHVRYVSGHTHTSPDRNLCARDHRI